MKEWVEVGFCEDRDEPLVWVEKKTGTFLLVIDCEEISRIIDRYQFMKNKIPNLFTSFTFAIIDGATRVRLPCFPF
jgi:hypothetical protein